MEESMVMKLDLGVEQLFGLESSHVNRRSIQSAARFFAPLQGEVAEGSGQDTTGADNSRKGAEAQRRTSWTASCMLNLPSVLVVVLCVQVTCHTVKFKPGGAPGALAPRRAGHIPHSDEATWHPAGVVPCT